MDSDRGRVGRSSSGFWLFAILLGECKTVGIGMGADPRRSCSGAGLFSSLPLAVKGLTIEN